MTAERRVLRWILGIAGTFMVAGAIMACATDKPPESGTPGTAKALATGTPDNPLAPDAGPTDAAWDALGELPPNFTDEHVFAHCAALFAADPASSKGAADAAAVQAEFAKQPASFAAGATMVATCHTDICRFEMTYDSAETERRVAGRMMMTNPLPDGTVTSIPGKVLKPHGQRRGSTNLRSIAARSASGNEPRTATIYWWLNGGIRFPTRSGGPPVGISQPSGPPWYADSGVDSGKD